MTVGFGARRRHDPDRTAGAARAVVDHDRLAEDFLKRRRDRAGGQIGLTAGRKRHDQGDVSRRPSLRLPDTGDSQHNGERRRCADQASAKSHLHSSLNEHGDDFRPSFLFSLLYSAAVGTDLAASPA